ncbi:MAG: divalent-cation tolerance protein CutA [Patescibacteria group bacterium]
MVFIYTTCKNIDEAKKLGRSLIEKHLAACVNIWPINSMYFWKEELRDDAEAALLIKTNEPKVADIEDFITTNHSYSTPLAATVNVHRLNRAYKEWMSTVVL